MHQRESAEPSDRGVIDERGDGAIAVSNSADKAAKRLIVAAVDLRPKEAVGVRIVPAQLLDKRRRRAAERRHAVTRIKTFPRDAGAEAATAAADYDDGAGHRVLPAVV